MGRSAENSADRGRPERRIDPASLDDRIASILAEIEQEKTPQRLLELATALQEALISRRRQARPN
jgi:hypothetical protein